MARDVVYVSDACPSCHLVTDALARAPVPGLRVLNIDRDPLARDYFFLTGARGVPAAVVGDRLVVGAYEILVALRLRG